MDESQLNHGPVLGRELINGLAHLILTPKLQGKRLWIVCQRQAFVLSTLYLWPDVLSQPANGLIVGDAKDPGLHFRTPSES